MEKVRDFDFLSSRRRLLWGAATAGVLAGLERLTPAFAFPSLPADASVAQRGSDGALDLSIGEESLRIDGRHAAATAINGTVPGPLLRLTEGEDVTLRVSNHLSEDSSIHWHGLLVPPDMDGVPGVSFSGIAPGTTFTYKYPVRQSGTYWYHSHSGLQEQSGVFGPLIIDPAEREPFAFDRDYVVMISDWTFEDPHRILVKLKKRAGYYNFQRRTVGDLFRAAQGSGFWTALSDRLRWGRMRMDPTDIADITGYTYTYLLNGLSPDGNWTGLFEPGERVRLRFINAGAASYFDVRIPGLSMNVVQADGQNIQPVTVDELRIAIAETYDVIVQPEEGRAYTVFAEAMDRSGYARGTLAPREGMSGPVPERRPRPLRTMADMGMSGMDSMGSMGAGDATPSHGPGHAMPGMEQPAGSMSDMAAEQNAPVMHGPDHHGPGNSMVARMSRSLLDQPGRGLEGSGRRVLVYQDLQSFTPHGEIRGPDREIELHLTGNMERYMWSFDGKKFSQVEGPIPFRYGELLRVTLVNDTMMDHPIHLHGMWMVLDNGSGARNPRKHTLNVKPAERISFLVDVDAPGKWAFHCHILYHMDMGMFRVVEVSEGPQYSEGVSDANA